MVTGRNDLAWPTKLGDINNADVLFNRPVGGAPASQWTSRQGEVWEAKVTFSMYLDWHNINSK